MPNKMFSFAQVFDLLVLGKILIKFSECNLTRSEDQRYRS
jgi:hypothetical protein